MLDNVNRVGRRQRLGAELIHDFVVVLDIRALFQVQGAEQQAQDKSVGRLAVRARFRLRGAGARVLITAPIAVDMCSARLPTGLGWYGAVPPAVSYATGMTRIFISDRPVLRYWLAGGFREKEAKHSSCTEVFPAVVNPANGRGGHEADTRT